MSNQQQPASHDEQHCEENKKQSPEQSPEQQRFLEWKNAGLFSRSAGFGAHANQPYTVVIPPPNITGMLHMGHALNDTIQDALIRRARMQGYQTRWVLGTDHAGIATQTKVDKKLASEGISRLDIGREAFIEKCFEWREVYGRTIVEQIKGMGCSCDYDNENFTLDEHYARCVREVFANWYHDKLIYRGKRIVNWCPHCTTAIADDEAEYVEEDGHLWYLRYPLAEASADEPYIVVATTRPETMLGDTGVAVSPRDESKQHLVGKMVKLPLVNREIPIFADWHVDENFGTGFVKVTPSHDPNDWAMGEAHQLERINVFDETAHVVDGYGRFSGMTRDEAREAIVAAFDELGLLEKVEDHHHSVMTCYRCHTKLEPWESEQWFVRVDPLKQDAARVVEDGAIQFYPSRWKHVYLDWLANLKDWCISRQLWWGHRIPMYYCDTCGFEDAFVDEPSCCPQCGSALRQDTDVLDTWFSSQLWPFATLGWNAKDQQGSELAFAYPTQVLSTARDIMGLWVARMVMSSLYCTGKIPFEKVIIHPTVMGADGKPMSKSRGNGVDPLRLMKDYGADGMRFGLLSQVSGAQDLRFNEAQLEGSRNFANKIRNAARFVTMHLDNYTPGAPEARTLADKWMLSRLYHLVKDVDAAFDSFEFADLTRSLYSFFWNEFCDWYIEFSKSRLSDSAPADDKAACQRNLVFVLSQSIRLLAPLMPFITEDIYQELRAYQPESEPAFLMSCSWPEAKQFQQFDCVDAEHAFASLCEVIGACRSTRARYGLSPKTPLSVRVVADKAVQHSLEQQQTLLCAMAHIETLHLCDSASKEKEVCSVMGHYTETCINLHGLVDFAAELARLNKEYKKVESDVLKFSKKLSNEAYLSKAAPEIIAKDRQKLEDAQKKLASLEEQRVLLA